MCVSAACLREGLRHIRQTNVSCLLVRLSLFSTIYFLFFLMLLFTFLHSLFFSPAFLFLIPLFPSPLLRFTLLYFLCTLHATQSLVLAQTVLLSLVSFFLFLFLQSSCCHCHLHWPCACFYCGLHSPLMLLLSLAIYHFLTDFNNCTRIYTRTH